jgi:transcriptional regulator with XRE-family HTH domain
MAACEQVFSDELEQYLEEARQDPAFRAAYEDAEERHSILDRLVRLRRAMGLSQTIVAQRMGVRQPTISGFETEDSDPHLSTLQRYARAVHAKVRVVVMVPSECDWVPTACTYRGQPRRTTGATVREGELAQRWRAEPQWSEDRWALQE